MCLGIAGRIESLSTRNEVFPLAEMLPSKLVPPK